MNHFDGELHKCHCGSIFRSKAYLRIHQQTHSGEVTCELCSVSFEHLGKLNYHLEAKHPNRKCLKQKKSKCKFLGIAFSFCKLKNVTPSLSSIALILKRQGPFFCDKCGSRYLDRNSMMKHFRLKHLQQKPLKRIFTCDACGYANSKKKLFKLHMSKHRSKIECKICNRKFVNIEKHLEVHAKATFLVKEQNSRQQLIPESKVIPDNGMRVLRR